MHWRTSLAINAQGSKEINLGGRSYVQNAGQYIITPFDLPVTSRVCAASAEKPYLSLLIIFDPLLLSEAAQSINDSAEENIIPRRSVFVGDANDKMLEAAIRLIKLFETPDDARALGYLVIKEILYYLLKAEQGAAIRRFVRAGSVMSKISEVIHYINGELARDIDIRTLADIANMSRATLFKNFKEITSMSPVQYQKRLRLLEARGLMIAAGETAEGAAFKVGYKSASQFNREYSRMFGNPPHRNVAEIKRIGQYVNQS